MHRVGRRGLLALASLAMAGSARAGLLPVSSDAGSFILFAADPGGLAQDGPQGGNSPFSRALATALLGSRDADLDSIARQVIREVRSATAGRQRPQAVSTLADAIRPGRQKLRALVAGVSRYDLLPAAPAARAAGPEATGRLISLPQTPNAGNDAILVAAALRAVGGEIVGGRPLVDPTRAELLAGLRGLAQGERDEVRLLFFAGNGIEVDGRALLLARDAPMPRGIEDLAGAAISVPEVLEMLRGSGAPAVLVLDTCRDNPFDAASAAR